MVNNTIQLTEKMVGKIEGEFYVPSYQRGYRWDEMQVKALLDDIDQINGDPYCLQPVVVRKDEHGRYELIDGQQRLTTIYIIYKYIKTIFSAVSIKYSLTYETRNENANFFNNIDDESIADTNIDFFFIHKAYCTVRQWFEAKGTTKSLYIATDFLKRFENQIRVIWYELQDGSEADAIALFTRLNIGRIPLTNAELVKALFLCSSNYVSQTDPQNTDRRLEISLQWDTIEGELHDENFWYFLTTKGACEYSTKIELLFDFFANKPENTRDQFYTFLYFNEQKRHNSKKELWDDVLSYYSRLKEWYKNDTLYHKIGYLVASKYSTINKLMEATKGKRKSEMNNYLDCAIKDSINCNKPYGELTYNNDYNTITNILLLFNVTSLMKTAMGSRFPFKSFNNVGKDCWTLEHIHAQHSLNLNTQEKWKEWLRLHLQSIVSLKTSMADIAKKEEVEELIKNIEKSLQDDKLKDTTFNDLSDQVIDILSKKGESTEYVHSLSNMALLQKSKNSELNNSLFDVKRRKIIEMDSQGQFIPYCTKMVFMKYYSAESQDGMSFHFWGESDRIAYIGKMNEVLRPYLKEELIYGTE